jgi:hypothetical protein
MGLSDTLSRTALRVDADLARRGWTRQQQLLFWHYAKGLWEQARGAGMGDEALGDVLPVPRHARTGVMLRRPGRAPSPRAGLPGKCPLPSPPLPTPPAPSPQATAVVPITLLLVISLGAFFQVQVRSPPRRGPIQGAHS